MCPPLAGLRGCVQKGVAKRFRIFAIVFPGVQALCSIHGERRNPPAAKSFAVTETAPMTTEVLNRPIGPGNGPVNSAGAGIDPRDAC